MQRTFALPFVAMLAAAVVFALATERAPPRALPSRAARPAGVRLVRIAPLAPRLAVRIPALQPSVPSDFDREQAMSTAELMNRWNPDIAKASTRFGVPASWLRSVMLAESGGRTMESETQKISSSMGAVGLMQLMPETYNDMRVQYGLGRDPTDPHDNIVAGAGYLRWLFQRYGYPAMFAAYNDGPGNLEQRLIDGRMLPTETQLYVASITGEGPVLRGGAMFRGGPKSMVKFTRPNGEPVMINGYEVMAVRAPFPDEYTPDVHAVIRMGRAQQGVRESVGAVKSSLRRHGARV